MKTNTKELLEQLMESVRTDETFNSTVLLEDAASGSAIPAGHLNKIRRWTQKDIPAEQIHTYPVLMIDTAPTRNMVIYTAESQKKTVKKWPGTTFLFNFHAAGAGIFSGGQDHTLQAASQVARIYDAKLVKTPKGEIGTLAWFYTVEGVDEHVDAFIGKLDAGILREVSIHISAPDGVVCSIDNDAFSKCYEKHGTDHYPGEKYGKVTCYMSTGEGALIPLELSAVACPGSVNAHVMQDDEVEDYPVVSLREALGGSDEAINQIRQENEMRTKDQVAEARKKLAEAAKAAGVELREFVVKHDKDTEALVEAADINQLDKLREFLSTEAAKCSSCGHAAHSGEECGVSGCECGQEAAKKCSECGHGMHEGACGVAECECKEGKEKSNDDGTQGDPPQPDKSKKQSLVGDDETCVVCGREAHPQTPETVQVETVRAEFKAQVTALVEKSNTAIAAANSLAEDATTRAKERDDLFSDFVEGVVLLAIKHGVKKSSEKEAYQETLMGLPYQAVKEIRETLLPKEILSEKDAAKNRLQETAAERAKTQLGATKTKTGENGRTSTTTQRPMFGAK